MSMAPGDQSSLHRRPTSSNMRQVLLVWSLLVWPSIALSVLIPNNQLGKAEIECAEKSIEIVFLTEDVFRGRVFVLGHANDSDCSTRDTGRKTTSIVVPRDKCGVTTTRSTNPPGLLVTTKVILSFHDEFITKVDRGYEISCLYMEEEVAVTYPFSVSVVSLEPINENAEQPSCRYEVLDPLTKKPVSVAPVGSQLLHQWVCDSAAPDAWCMTVHSCSVEDGRDNAVMLLDKQGCATDRHLLDNLKYGPDPLHAQTEALAFKFADRIAVNFQCSVKLDIKNGSCPLPTCAERVHPEIARVTKRSPSASDAEEDFRVRAQELVVLDQDLVPLPVQGRQCIPLRTLAWPASLCAVIILAQTLVISHLLSTR